MGQLASLEKDLGIVRQDFLQVAKFFGEEKPDETLAKDFFSTISAFCSSFEVSHLLSLLSFSQRSRLWTIKDFKPLMNFRLFSNFIFQNATREKSGIHFY